ncbi:hypothetical protein DL96DRAFT_1474425 [Flagelloscypha sp. PMI_526]|nr:hypothetical protein DL96DRAFT_1474425 [Flagelloscypha sp. PMI_526]
MLESPGPTRGRSCVHCGATSTSAWRRAPGSNDPLCNPCGLYIRQRNVMRPQMLIDADTDAELPQEAAYEGGHECSHCQSRATSVWRRSKEGRRLCNACGLYLSLRGKERPLSLKKNKLKPRAKRNGGTVAS